MQSDLTGREAGPSASGTMLTVDFTGGAAVSAGLKVPSLSREDAPPYQRNMMTRHFMMHELLAVYAAWFEG
jgi:hypothetical protein